MSTTTHRWRTVDIVVAAAIAVAFGVVFWAWNIAWEGFSVVLAFYPPLKALSYGVWMVPAVLAPLIIRKAGASVTTETIASTISMLMGSQWGMSVVWQGFLQGVSGELPFAAGRYRHWGVPVTVTSGGLAGAAGSIFDCFVWYPTLSLSTFQVPYVTAATLSGMVIAGLGAPALVKALAATGVLDNFPAGRQRADI